jgi:hypothetical protein
VRSTVGVSAFQPNFNQAFIKTSISFSISRTRQSCLQYITL